MKLVTDINFFPDETIVKLEDGEEIFCSIVKEDGSRMTKDELRALFLMPTQGELYVRECEDD